MAKIMIASAPGAREIAERILAGHDVTSTETLAQAKKCLLTQTYDLIICTISFNESRMFDLLRFVQSEPMLKPIPFICAAVKSTILKHPIALEGVKHSCLEMGAISFLNISDYQKDPERQMRRAIDRILQ